MNGQRELTESLLGAFADELSGAMDRAVHRVTGVRGESAAALTALLNTPELSVKELARFLGMRSPSAVQLVSKLQDEGLLARRPGPDARTRAIVLTASGRRTATQVLAARREQAALRLDQLSRQQQHELHAVLSSVLASMRGLDVDLDHLCRRCDESVCTPRRCPVGHGRPMFLSAASPLD